MLNRDQLVAVLDKTADKIIANKQFLSDLDQVIGDGDHGINMAKGFGQVKEKLNSVKDKDCGDIMKMVAMTLISSVGGASGPLYGTAYLKASAVLKGKMEISAEDYIKANQAAVDGIVMRGKAKEGEKTMLDAIIPALREFEAKIKTGATPAAAIKASYQAAQKGVEYTKTIIATKGRASYMGERSIGHQDPGATSSTLILQVLSEELN